MELNSKELHFLHKVLYRFKFLEVPSSSEYDELIYSPIYGEIFAEVRQKLHIVAIENSIDPERDRRIWLKDSPVEKERIIELINSYEEKSELTDAGKLKCLRSLVFPFEITDQEEREMLLLFN